MDPLLNLAIALPISVLLISASQHKRADLPRFRAQLGAYDVLPASTVATSATLLPWAELGTGLALLVPALRPAAAAIACALFATYALAIAVNLIRGRKDIDCGCGGPAQPLSWLLVARNALLVGLSLALTLPVLERSLSAVDAFALGLTTLLACLGYLAAGQLLHNQAILGGWRHER